MRDDQKTKKQLIIEVAELRARNADLNISESEKYRSLVENIRDVIYELDSQGVVLYISPAIRDMLGYDSAEIVGKNFIDLAHKEDQSSLAEWFSELRKGREDPSEYRISNKTGELRWARTNTRPIMENGLFKGARGILIDVTAQRRTEQALRESEGFFKAIIQNSSDIILIVDKLGTIAYASPPIERFLGYRPDELIGKRTLDLIVSDDKPRAIADFGRALLTKEVPIPNVFRIRHKNGAERILEGIGRNLLDNPIVKGFVMNVRDITERKQAENAQRESEARYRELIDFLPISIFEVDTEGGIISFNRTALEVFKYNKEDYKEGMNALQFFAPEEWRRVGENMGKVIEGTSIPGQEFTFLRKDGSKFPGLIYASPDIRQNKTVGIRGVIIDITERKSAEEKLSESEKKYRELYDFLPIPVYEMDLDANITSANRAIYETFRGTEEDLMKGFKGWQLLSPEEIDKSIKNIERLLKGEKLGGAEYTLMRLDGSVFPAIVISSVIYSNENPVGLRGAIIDITQHKKAEEDLRRMNTFLDAIIENIPNMTFLKDAVNLRYVRFNQAGEDLLGYSRNSLLGKNDHDFFPKEQADFFIGKDREVLRGKVLVDIPEEPIQTRNKGERILHTKKVPILDVNGKPEYLLGISEDITEQKRTEKQLQDTLESLRKAVATTIQVISSTVEARDPYTSGHQTRSADLARAIAMEMGLPQDKIDGIRMAGSIHDIGKISIPAEILSKPTKLSEIEFLLIKEHANRGYEMLKDVESPWPLAEIVRQHHERIDGSGYPRKLKGEEILIEARILSVADVVEAMASHRPYRPGLGIFAALDEIEKNRGICYDDAVADACLGLFREKGFSLQGISYT